MGLMPNMRVVGVFNRRFDADLAVARLESAGIESVILSDTNPETGNLSLGARGFRVAVHQEIAEDAAVVLNGEDPTVQAEIDELDLAFYERRFADRPAWIRYATWAVLAAMAGPIAVVALIEVGWLVRGLFP
ncbi:MAG: hypothetical protein AAF081_09170 [Actinomycetota bacterium]